MFIKYSNIIVQVEETTSGYKFYSPYSERWIEVEGDYLYCKNRIHQHLHVQHNVPLGTVEEIDTEEERPSSDEESTPSDDIHGESTANDSPSVETEDDNVK